MMAVASSASSNAALIAVLATRRTRMILSDEKAIQDAAQVEVASFLMGIAESAARFVRDPSFHEDVQMQVAGAPSSPDVEEK